MINIVSYVHLFLVARVSLLKRGWQEVPDLVGSLAVGVLGKMFS